MRWLKSTLMIIVSVGLLVLTARLVGAQALLAGTSVLHWWTIVAALGCGLLTTAAQAMRWKLLLHSRGTRLGWLRATADCYSSSFLNAVLPGGLSGDLARVAVYRHTGEHKWWSPLAVVAAERLSVTALLFTIATFTLAGISAPLALLTGAIALTALVFSLYGMRKIGLNAALVVWLTSVTSVGALFLLYIIAMLALDGPVVPVLAIAGLASMSLPIGVGGWGIREISVSIVAAGAAVSVDAAVSTATGYGLLALISVLPGLGTLLVQAIVRRGATGPESVQNDAAQQH